MEAPADELEESDGSGEGRRIAQRLDAGRLRKNLPDGVEVLVQKGVADDVRRFREDVKVGVDRPDRAEDAEVDVVALPRDDLGSPERRDEMPQLETPQGDDEK